MRVFITCLNYLNALKMNFSDNFGLILMKAKVKVQSSSIRNLRVGWILKIMTLGECYLSL